jgi:hypothetical protein
VEVPAERIGQFFAGDCYLVHYQYSGDAGVSHIVYFWLGRSSSVIEQGSAAARTVELCNSLVSQRCRCCYCSHCARVLGLCFVAAPR